MCLATWIQNLSYVHDVLPHGYKCLPVSTFSCHMETKSSLCARCFATCVQYPLYLHDVLPHGCMQNPPCVHDVLPHGCIQNPPCVHDVLPHGYKIVPVCTVSCHMDTKSSLCARSLATWIQNPPCVHDVLPHGDAIFTSASTESRWMDGWVTVTCMALRPPQDLFGVEFCADSTNVFRMRLQTGVPACRKISYAR